MLYSVIRKVVIPSLILFACMSIVIGCVAPMPGVPKASSESGITINGATRYQTIDGFGISEAFGQANLLRQLSPTDQQQVLDYLFDASTGAGFNILRNLISSSPDATIEPTSPENPAAPPNYVWKGDDGGQVWLSQLVKKKYGLTQFYASAWSAPGFMKTNGSEANGGHLCGSPDTSCSSGDWRQAYANYLVQYLRYYQAEGITIPYVGFANEPDLSETYSSMQMSPQQAVDFIKVLGPTLKNAGLSTKIICCDAMDWWVAKQTYIPAISNDPIASSYVSVYSSHGYNHGPDSPLTSTNAEKRSWQTEWSTIFDLWDNKWDNDQTRSGFRWAQHIHTALTAANLNAFFYWWGAADDKENQMLIRINGSSLDVSKRLWAFANYSRFVRPGATRIGATSSNNNMLVSAFRNTDGSVAIVALNTGTQDITIPIALLNMNIPDGSSVIPYVTNDTNNTAKKGALAINDGSFSTMVTSRSLVTYTIPAKKGV